MQRSLRGRMLILAAVLLWAIWWLVPTVRAATMDQATRQANWDRWEQEDEQAAAEGGAGAFGRLFDRWWGGQRAITLGLDLRGGMHLVMEVDTDAAVANELSRLKTAIENQAAETDVHLTATTVPDDLSLTIECDPADSAAVSELLHNMSDEASVTGAGGRFHVQLPARVADRISDLSVRQALETIRNRVDEFGVAEPVLQRQGTDRILIQLPGVSDPQRVLRLIGRTAVLEFAEVYDQAQSEVEIRKKLGYRIPRNRVIRPGFRHTQFGREQGFYLLDADPVLTGADLTDARVSPGQFGDYVVAFRLDAAAGRRFARWTGNHIGTPMAIILDGVVQQAPTIRSRIRDSGQIEGSYTLEEAEDLAIILRAGALPAPVHVIEQRTVGPTLGHDSIVAGVRAALLGFALVLIFMVLYYRAAGFIAVVALLLNVLLVLAALAAFGATLTLPGIAGLILTIGMAVDANVLIFERVREELDKGKTLRSAVDAGFERVTLTILDANVTTLITALVLFQFGTGPVKGFAVTLSIGIIASLYTALVVTRMALDWLTYWRGVTKLSLTRMVGETHVPFIRVRRLAMAGSLVLIVVGLGRFWQRGSENFGIDFTQGTVVQARLTPPHSVGEVRRALLDAHISNPVVQQVGDEGDLLIRTAFIGTGEEEENAALTGQRVKEVLIELAGAPDRVDVLRTEEVGAAVSRDLRDQALLALLYSMGAIIIYISFRFEFRFAIAAVVALLHDVSITMGMFALTGSEISLPVVAALLTIVGYSLNDTIVVFDRIRENSHAMRGVDYDEMINVSINETLSRTLLTSATTLFVVVVLWLFGGPVIHGFAFALMVGIIVGTYSSIFIASPILSEWQRLRPQRGRSRVQVPQRV